MYNKAGESTMQRDMRHLQQSVYGRIEDLASKGRLKLCLQEGLYTPCDTMPYTRERIASLMQQANTRRWLSGVSGRQL
jgi:hypothetical protein